MDIDSGKLYSKEDVRNMSDEDRKKLLWISRKEFQALIDIPEEERPAKLREMRYKSKNKAKAKRKQQKASRKKNR